MGEPSDATPAPDDAGRGRRVAVAAVTGVVAVALGAAVVVNGSGADRDDVGWADDDTPSAAASPFTVGEMLPGFEVRMAGPGAVRPDWGQDSVGTTEPVTVLAPAGQRPTPANTVLVSVTGYLGYQDGLRQASAGWLDNAEEHRLDGRDAVWAAAEPDDDRHRNDLVVAFDDDLAVRVAAERLGRARLADLVDRVEPRGQDEPPAVDPPPGLEVVGGASATFEAGRSPAVVEGADAGPGPVGGYGLGWVEASSERELVVVTLPGRAADLEVLLADASRHGRPLRTSTVDVDGRGGVLQVEGPGEGCGHWCDSDRRASLFTTTSWGDVLMVSIAGGQAGTDELVAVAASVRQVDEATWESTVDELMGGPGLGPDPGAEEVARGAEGGVEWLLQARPLDDDDLFQVIVPPGTWTADPCLKVAARRRQCAEDHSLHDLDETVRLPPDPEVTDVGERELPPFVIVETSTEAASLRVRYATEEVVAPMHRLPGEEPRWAGVAFIDVPGMPHCIDPDAAVQMDLLDEAGAEVDCVGIS